MKPPAAVSSLIFTEMARMPFGRMAAITPPSLFLMSLRGLIGSPGRKGARAMAPEYSEIASGLLARVM